MVITLDITNADERPTLTVTQANSRFSETSDDGGWFTVATFSFTDPDTNPQPTWNQNSLAPTINGGAQVQVNGNNIQVRGIDVAANARNQQFTITLNPSTSGAGPELSRTITFGVDGVPNPVQVKNVRVGSANQKTVMQLITEHSLFKAGETGFEIAGYRFVSVNLNNGSDSAIKWDTNSAGHVVALYDGETVGISLRLERTVDGKKEIAWTDSLIMGHTSGRDASHGSYRNVNILENEPTASLAASEGQILNGNGTNTLILNGDTGSSYRVVGNAQGTPDTTVTVESSSSGQTGEVGHRGPEEYYDTPDESPDRDSLIGNGDGANAGQNTLKGETDVRDLFMVDTVASNKDGADVITNFVQDEDMLRLIHTRLEEVVGDTAKKDLVIYETQDDANSVLAVLQDVGADFVLTNDDVWENATIEIL
jgi:hypothetical protein